MYDLLHNVPMVRRLFAWIFGGWFQWFERAVIIRLTSVLTLIMPQLRVCCNLIKAQQLMCNHATPVVTHY